MIKPTIEEFKWLWLSQYTYQAIIVGTVLVVVDLLWYHTGLIGWLVYGLLWTTFDVFGWHNIIRKYDDIVVCSSRDHYTVWLKTSMLAYRSIQTMTQYLFLIPVAMHWGWGPVAACMITWWFGGYDLLYYGIARARIEDHLPWVEGWSVHIIFNWIVTRNKFIVLAVIGYVIGGVVCLSM